MLIGISTTIQLEIKDSKLIYCYDLILQTTCPIFSVVAPSTGSGTNQCAGIGPATWTNILAPPAGSVQTNIGWQKFSIDLSTHLNHPVTIEVFVAHCNIAGHFGYGYFDANCGTLDLGLNTSTISMPNQNVLAQDVCGNSATLTAPGGFNPYVWRGPSSFTSSSQTIVRSTPLLSR